MYKIIKDSNTTKTLKQMKTALPSSKSAKAGLVILMNVLLILICSFSAKGPTPWFAPKDAESVSNPLANNPEAAKNGAVIFQKNCVLCHGNKGKGDGPVGANLQTKPANLTSPAVQANTDGSLFWKIGNGRAPMPSFKSVLKDEQRWQLVNYLRTLAKK
jgi:mono/diheme cytochrome c family protein